MLRGQHAQAGTLLLVGFLLLAQPPAAPAWEGRAHRLIAARAIGSLPYPLRGFFEANRLSLVQLCADPSLWGEVPRRPEQGFIQLDFYGRFPFPELPRDYNDSVRKFGRETLTEHGILPWQVGTYSLKLEEAFRNQQWDQVKLYAAVLARYVGEAHDPFNTTMNSNGQLSNQLGVESRYAISLVDRYQMFFIIRPGGAYKIEDPTAHAFGMVLEAHTWVDNILLADSQARSGKLDYNDDYYDAFYTAAGPILIRQLTNASQNVGAYWYTAWVNAGSPTPPLR
ncbi:MAG: hypothetical protein ACE5HL_07635 [Terriglobia bacterium]